MTDFLKAEKKLKSLLPKILAGRMIFNSACKKDLSPFAIDLISGILRHHVLLNHLIDHSLKKKLSHQDTRTILLIGLYRLYFQSNEPKRIMQACMTLCDTWKLHHRKGLVYAILQRHAKNPEKIDLLEPAIRYSIPKWFIDDIVNTFPEHHESILKAQEQRPKPWVNWLSHSPHPEDFITPYPNLKNTGQFQDDKSLQLKSGFEDGHWQIQDLSSQLMIEKTPIQPTRILDACAAPGGKAIHLAKKFPQAKIFATEINAARFRIMAENTLRIKCDNLKIIHADCTEWIKDQEQFDLIWLDAPCSGSGVLKKHPDIKLTLSDEKFLHLKQTQISLLKSLWAFVKTGGVLAYSTCSLLQRENDEIIELFLQTSQASIIDAQPDDFSIVGRYGRYYPIASHHGGYLSLLQKD